MPNQSTLEITRQDPIAKFGQDLLYFPNAIPEVTAQLVDALTGKHGRTVANTPEQIVAKVQRDVVRTFIGVVATVVYADLAEHVVSHIQQNRPLVTEQFSRSPFYMHGDLPKYVGYADDFARAATAWLFGAAARVHRRAENPDDRYYPLMQGLIASIRDHFLYIAVDPAKRIPSKEGHPKDIQARLERTARHAATNFSYSNLLDNVKVALEMLLHFGLAYSREERVFPGGDQLTAAALANAHMMGRAATIGAKSFAPMAHTDPLATTFHQYELTQLADVQDLYPACESIFMRQDGVYTFRHPPITQGPKKEARNCPARRLWRPPEPRGQDAIEGLFDCAEQYGDCSIPRPGDGTYQTSVGVFVFGSFIAKETIYAAWPKGDIQG